MLPNLRNALLIHNPNAGTGGGGRRRMLDEARRIFARSGIEADLQETRGPAGGRASIFHRRVALDPDENAA